MSAVDSSGPADDSSFRRDPESMSGLLSRLLSDAAALLRNEVALAKTEVSKSIDSLKVGIAAVAVAGIVLLGAFLTLIACAVLALAHVLEPWLAAGIVGVALALIGFLMMQAAKRKLSQPGIALDRTKDSLQRDAAVARRA
jgi:Putative Actinobacterial Holin-X, holin superfamily III